MYQASEPQMINFQLRSTDLDADTRRARASCSIALVSLPFVSLYRPSIQIGLLKSIAAAHGFLATTLHLNLDFGRQIGPELYEKLCRHRGRMFGDWLFSLAAFGELAPDPEDNLIEVFGPEVELLLADLNETPERLRMLRHNEVPSYLDHLMEEIPWSSFRVVGFTSTFQQSVASFALARRIKERFPHVITLFGGANFEGVMGLELVRAIECVDYAILGEGDRAFPEFLVALQEGRDPSDVPGVARRLDGQVKLAERRSPFRFMDELPIPDYGEYFERAEGMGLLAKTPRRTAYIPFESARGCWWGQKHHCTFCGLNGADISYRAKSPQRVFSELAQLAQRYRSFRFEAVDNILDLSYLKQFFPSLIEAGTDYEFFYELKSNLTREKIKLLAEGGLRRMQPGIESLSSHVLKLMRKGVTAIQNVNTLRWALYYDISVGWNLLWGFPGETEADYQQQLELLRSIVHLQPPGGAGRIWMERFSPIFTDREAFPAKYVRPEASYAYVYPDHVNLEEVAYFFDYDLENTLPPSVFEETAIEVRRWQFAWEGVQPPTLTFWSAPEFVQIEDMRDPAQPGTYTFRSALASMYVACSDKPRSASELKDSLQLLWPEGEIEAALDEFCTRKLMMREGNSFLSLAIPATQGR